MGDIKKFAVIVAGGKGTRMGTETPKQFLDINGKPVLYHTVNAFVQAMPDAQIIVVLPEGMQQWLERLKQHLPENTNIIATTGGATRFHSVQNGLNAITEDGIVFVHDAARPIISKAMIFRCLQTTIEQGCAIPAIPVAESLRAVDGEQSRPVDRSTIRVIQTPQTFKTEIIKPAFQQPFSEQFTDEATVLEAFGGTVHLVEGEKKNIKITTPEDLIIAQTFLNSNS